jgi:DNA polymerase-3 subunit epsilon
MKWLSRQPLTPLAKAYRDATSPKVNRQTSFDELSFAVLDTETTGLDVRRDRLLSLALVPVRQNQIHVAQIRSWLVYQPRTLLNEAVQVHGIFPEETATGQPEPDVLAEFLPLISGQVLVGHHLRFDAAMIDAAMKRHYHIGLRNPLIDTADLAMGTFEAFGRTPYPGQRPPSLDELCSYCEIEPMDRHTAEGDAFTTAELFLVICARLQKLRGRPLLAKDLPLKKL